MLRVVELTGDTTPDIRAIEQADIIVTTPEKWDGISRSWQNRYDHESGPIGIVEGTPVYPQIKVEAACVTTRNFEPATIINPSETKVAVKLAAVLP